MSKKALQISHHGAKDEILSAVKLPAEGSYKIYNLSSQMEILSNFHAEQSDFSFVWDHHKFSIEIPAGSKISQKDKLIWNGHKKNIQARFRWATLPEGLHVDFLNGQSVSFKESDLGRFEVRNSLRIAAMLMVILFGHAIFSFISMTSFKEQTQSISKKIEKAADISKMQVSVANTMQTEPSHPSLAKLRAAQSLFDSFNVGEPIKDANVKLKPTLADRLLKEAGYVNGLNAKEAASQTWNLDDVEINTPSLNLSQSQISKALRPVNRDLKECYDDVLIRDSSLKGRPKLILDISKKGRVRSVEITDLYAKQESIRQLTRCFKSSYTRVQLPTPNQDFVVIYPLILVN